MSTAPSTPAIRQVIEQLRRDELPDVLDFPALEQATLAWWEEIKAFETSLKQSEGRKPYTFYDGPPFATGLPHYGHLLAGTIKDVVCRYAHQTGHHVERRFGWDCHGLPIEFEIEKELGIKSSHDVKKLGIDKYNAACRSIVMRYSSEWEKIVARCGRWIDFKNDYKTMDVTFMESVWWVFKTLWSKGLVYRGFKVMPYSTACTTPLSNFECNMNYKETTDPSLVVTFPLVDDAEGRSFVAWTTTPWTLPSNLALCVNPSMVYVTVAVHRRESTHVDRYIVAESRMCELQATDKEATYEVVSRCEGSALIGLRYVPLFPYFTEKMRATAFRVVGDAYVSRDSGTGIVHTAPGFGEDDYRICVRDGVVTRSNVVCPVDENGCFTAEVPEYAGRYIKDCDNDIAAAIKRSGRLLSKGSVTHSYPFCWRSETPLIYKAVDAWFVAVERIRDKLVAANDETYWVPDFVKSRRFSNWICDANDWNVSRNRYWGTPLPVWHSEDWEEVVCVGSIEELERLSGVSGITDLHREFVDGITIPSARAGMKPLRRVEQVFDCWFESGSMPYGQCHYPFENADKFLREFPADFIAEGLDQTRGWFYTLLVLSAALFDKPPFRNLVVNGLVLAADGKKMSKRLKNYPEVGLILEQYGADALRLYLINSPVVRAEPLRFREQGVKDVLRDVMLPLFNVLKLFSTNAARFLSEHADAASLLSEAARSPNDMDGWILAAAQTLVRYVRREMEGYRLYTVVPGILTFVDTLTNWYVRMNRRRLKGLHGREDWGHSLATLLQVLFVTARVLAPLAPFAAENIYQRIKCLLSEQHDSVHYLMIPEVDTARFDDALEQSMSRMVKVIEMVRVARSRLGVPMKMAVASVVVVHPDAAYLRSVEASKARIEDEANTVELVTRQDDGVLVQCDVDVNLAVLGKRLKQETAQVRCAVQRLDAADVRASLSAHGVVVVCGHTLTADDLRFVRTPRAGLEHYETVTDGDVSVLVDRRQDDALLSSWRAREFVSRVQGMRKSCGLSVGDVVDVFFATDSAVLRESLERSRGQVTAALRCRWDCLPDHGAASLLDLVSDAAHEIDGASIRVVLAKP